MEPETTITEDAPTGLDMDTASDQIGASLFPDRETPEPETTTPAEAVTEAIAPAVNETPAPVIEEASAPKSWPKEMHPHWSKVPKEVQTYWQTREKQMLDGLEQYKGAAQYGRAIQEVITPFQHLIPQGVEPPQAIEFLLRANQRLTTGTMESRQAAYRELGQNLKLTPTDPSQPQTPIDPRIQSLEQQFSQVQQTLVAQQHAALTAARDKAGQEVEAFASDPKNAFFDEVHEDIIRFIKAGASLQEAYDKAIWVNPVTREKQMQARLQTETEKAKERARLDALPKNKAKGVNVRGRETARSHVEPLGNMQETMKATLATIKSRATH